MPLMFLKNGVEAVARRTKEESERTRTKLLDAAERLFLKHGVAETSLDDIAKAAHLTRGAVYWHFTDKGDIFRAMHERVKLPLDALFEDAASAKDPAAALRNACIVALTRLQTDKRVRNVYTILTMKCGGAVGSCSSHTERMRKMRAEIDRRLKTVFTRMKKDGALAKRVSPQIAATALHAMLTGLYQDYLRNPSAIDMKKAAPQFVDAFFSGIAA